MAQVCENVCSVRNVLHLEFISERDLRERILELGAVIVEVLLATRENKQESGHLKARDSLAVSTVQLH